MVVAGKFAAELTYHPDVESVMGRHLGNLSLIGSRTDWRNRPGHDDSYGLSWGTSIGVGLLSLNWNQNRTLWRNGEHRKENITSLWFSMPLPLDGE